MTTKNEDDKHLKDKLLKEIEVLKAEKTKNASKISSLTEKCRSLEENRDILQAEISELKSARKSLEDAHRSCNQKIVALQREKNVYVEEVLSLKMQLDESIKDKDSLMVEKVSLEKALKGKDIKIRDLNKKLEILQLSVVSSKNQERKWKWVFFATSIIFVNVSLAYAAGR